MKLRLVLCVLFALCAPASAQRVPLEGGGHFSVPPGYEKSEGVNRWENAKLDSIIRYGSGLPDPPLKEAFTRNFSHQKSLYQAAKLKVKGAVGAFYTIRSETSAALHVYDSKRSHNFQIGSRKAVSEKVLKKRVLQLAKSIRLKRR